MLHRGIVAAFTLLVMFTYIALAQNVGIGTSTPHPSARLEISAQNQGLLIPRLSTTQRNAIPNPAHSLLIFNIDNFCIEVYDSVSGQWLAVSCPISCPACDTTQCLTPSIDSISGPDTICSGDTVQYILHGSGGNAFIWNIPANWVMLSQGQLATFIADSSGTIYGHLCNQCGCSSDSIIVTTITPPPSVSLSSPDSVCIIDTIVILASGGTFYNWYVPSGWTIIYQGDSLVALPSDTGIYYVGVEACNNCGCSPKDSLQIVVLDTALGTVTIAGPTFACAGDTIVFKAPNPNATVWNWQFPSSWQLITQSGDSIVLVPDTVDGDVIVEACSSGCVWCRSDTLTITADSCFTFCIAIGGSGNDEAFDITVSSSGDIIITGYTTSFSGTMDIYIAKLSPRGNLIWTRNIDFGNDELSTSIFRIRAQEKYIIGGHELWGNGIVLSIDSSGNLLWSKVSSVLNYNWGGDIDADNHFVAAGEITGFIGRDDMSVLKIDSMGNVVNSASFGTASAHDEAFGFIQSKLNSNAHYIVGRTRAGIIGGADLVVIKTDRNFNILWEVVVGGGDIEDGYGITETSEGDIIAVGCTKSFGAVGYDAYIVKIDSNGNLLWTKVIGGSGDDIAYDVIEDSDGNIIVVGTTNSPFSSGGYDMYVIKLDKNGNILWAKTIGGSGNEGDPFWMGGYNYGTHIRIIEHLGGYVIVGSTTSFGNGGKDMYIVRINKDGTLPNCTNCIVNSGGTFQSGGNVSNGIVRGSGITLQNSAGNITSGGTATQICP